MCQATIKGLSNHCESRQVQKVASLLTEALSSRPPTRAPTHISFEAAFLSVFEGAITLPPYPDHTRVMLRFISSWIGTTPFRPTRSEQHPTAGRPPRE